MYKNIIKQAWQITQEEKSKLFPYAFILSFFTTIVGIIYFSYQFIAFQNSDIFSSNEHSINVMALAEQLWEFMKSSPSLGGLLVLCIVIAFLAYFLLPSLFSGVFIDIISKKALNTTSQKKSIVHGLENFFPVFEFSSLVSPFTFISFFSEISIIMRTFEIELWGVLLPIITIIFMIGIFLSILFSFAEQAIVIEKLNVIQAIKRSSILVLANVKDTLFLGFALTIIATRVFLNILLILLIPLVFMGIVTFMATITIKWLGMLLAVIISLLLFYVAIYLMAGFHIFSYSVWTLSFLAFREE
ncbi:hypothetical protein COB57_06155 [Candidatus Peregrinibacteria bacterium]|nr:MAG: hypothetical protein COB57_06155 [Candidatus Peregrinibacteria bacterium]